MHEYIKSHAKSFINKDILEISCGCGLVSITLSLIGAKLVIATELEDILNSNTKKNLLLNGLENSINLKLLTLEWDNSENMNNLFKSYSHLDYIILSECLYEDAPFDKLLLTLIKLCKFYNLDVFFAYKKRYIFQDNCMKKLKLYFQIEDIPRNEIHQDYRKNDNYQFFIMKFINTK